MVPNTWTPQFESRKEIISFLWYNHHTFDDFQIFATPDFRSVLSKCRLYISPPRWPCSWPYSWAARSIDFSTLRQMTHSTSQRLMARKVQVSVRSWRKMGNL